MKLSRILLGSLSICIVAASLVSAGSQKIFSFNITTIDTQGTLTQEEPEKKPPIPVETPPNVPSPDVKPAAEAEDKKITLDKLPNGNALNILIIGSDTREGERNREFGDPQRISGARADSTILININESRDKATVISIPRDLVIPIPECLNSTTGKIIPSRTARFNEAYALGGPGCAIKTTSQLFDNLPIDNIMIIDFAGFTEIIDSMGGLEICLNEPLRDKKSKLNLPAGKQLINGKQALSLARARYSLSDGSDIARIDRQQAILKEILSQMKTKNLQANPVALYNITQSFLSSLSLDEKLANPTKFASLIFTGLGIEEKNITYLTVPWIPRGDKATLSVDQIKFDKILTELKNTPQEIQEFPNNINSSKNDSQNTISKEKIDNKELNKNKLCKNPLF